VRNHFFLKKYHKLTVSENEYNLVKILAEEFRSWKLLRQDWIE